MPSEIGVRVFDVIHDMLKRKAAPADRPPAPKVLPLQSR
jgi:hypothetical protein